MAARSISSQPQLRFPAPSQSPEAAYQVALGKGVVMGAPQLAGSLVNEIGSPIGCALLIYIGQFVGRNVKILSSAKA